MKIYTQDTVFAIVRLDARAAIPEWAWRGPFWSITRTPAELSIVCEQVSVPPGLTAIERDFRALAVEGPLDFSWTGILASIASPLAKAGISLFAVSTFDTDYVLVREDRLAQALDALRGAGWEIGGIPVGNAE
jgi:uncharacterized protein